MQDPCDIAIVGYGIAGISSAIHLRRLGHRVHHFERNDTLGDAGAGMALHPAAMAGLKRLGVHEMAMKVGAPIRGFNAATLGGRTIMHFSFPLRDDGTGQRLGLQRRALIDILRAADDGRERLISGCRIDSVDSNNGYVIEASGRRHGPFDLIVAADGAQSAVRHGLPQLVRRDRSYAMAALVFMLDDPDQLAGDHVSQIFEGTTHAAFWPVGATSDRAVRRCNIALKVPLVRTEELRRGTEWRVVVRKLCKQLEPLMQQQLDAAQPLIFAYRDVALRSLHLGRVVFVGDAAHSTSPQIGLGARFALDDAAELADCVREFAVSERALRTFAERRRPAISRYQRLSRWVTPVFQSDSRVMIALRDAVAYRVSRLPILTRLLSA
jgi:2-polyprenyl-6-methoxyphenol hydroxylase-like FAD-dependent oxidoreductase